MAFTWTEISDILRQVRNRRAFEAFPVGAVFTSVLATNPDQQLGYGTWESFAAGKVLVGIDITDTDFDTVEKTGGAKEKAISAHAGTAVATHADHAHQVISNVAVADHDDHTHQVTSNVVATTTSIDTTAGATPVGTALTNNEVTSGGADAPLSHTVTNTAVTSGGVSAPLTHTVTQPSAHAELNVVQPFVVVYFWKRMA